MNSFSGGQYRVRNVTSYKEYCLRRGLEWNGDRYRRQLARPVRFEFESNEEEERAIAEAIAKEEELMRMEEERKRTAMGISVETDLTKFEEEIRRKELAMRREAEALRISSIPNRRVDENLAVRPGDSADLVQIKQVMNELVTQVCKWDKDYNWHKNLLRRARERHDIDRYYRLYKTSRTRQKQLEIDLNERIDRFRKEVNKRRIKLEGRAEAEIGMMVPWRRPRGRPNKSVRQQYATASAQTAVPVDPSEISLITDSDEATFKKEIKTEPSVTSTVVDPAAISLSDIPSQTQQTSADTPEITARGSIDGTLDSEHRAYHRYKTGADSTSGAEKSSEKDKPKKKLKKEGKESKSTDAHSVLRGRGRPRKEAGEPSKPSTSASQPGSSVEAKLKQPSSQDKLCLCDKPYNPKAVCYRWFHGKCVGITEKKWAKLKNWTCEECSREKAKDQVLYCFCRTPYDDSRFYVGCDKCEGWYHPQCVGITQAEAEAMGEYVCPTCKAAVQSSSSEPVAQTSTSFGGILTRKDYDLIGQLIASLKEHRASWPFRERVDEKMYPDYFKKITRPMDLSMLEDKIEQLRYHKLDDFVADFKLIFENARAYHPKSSSITRCADTLERKFEAGLVKVRKQIEMRNCERLRVSESRTADSLDINTDDLFPIGSDFDASLFDDII